MQSLKSGEDISRDMQILQELHKILSSQKQSFDSFLHYQMGLLKILAGTEETSQPSLKNIENLSQKAPTSEKITSDETPQTPETRKQETLDTLAQIDQTEEILEQAQDIFSQTVSENQTPETKNTE